MYRHICVLSIKTLLLSCLAHDFTFQSMLEPRASAGLATDGHSRASNLMLLLWVLKKATSPLKALCFSLKYRWCLLACLLQQLLGQLSVCVGWGKQV